MSEHEHVCPIWVGYLMISPVRKLQQNPFKILSPYVKSGMKILEIGPGMGYFSLPLAKLTGEQGIVYCVDIQQGMLNRLMKRAGKHEIMNIETRLCNQSSLNTGDLKQKIDFAFLFAVVHEIPDQKKLFEQVADAVKPGGKLFFAEPKGHVKSEQFEKSIALARDVGFKPTEEPPVKGSHVMLFERI